MKPLTFILTGAVTFAVLVGIFYAISRPVFSVTILKDVRQANLLVWTVIIGVPLALTAQIMRMVYGLFKRRRRR